MADSDWLSAQERLKQGMAQPEGTELHADTRPAWWWGLDEQDRRLPGWSARREKGDLLAARQPVSSDVGLLDPVSLATGGVASALGARKVAQMALPDPTDWLVSLLTADPAQASTINLAQEGEVQGWTQTDYLAMFAGLLPIMAGKMGPIRQDAAYKLAKQLMQQWGPAEQGSVRLFRGADLPYTSKRLTEHPGHPDYTTPERVETMGRWYTPDPGNALSYTQHGTGPLWKVDVPETQAKDFWLPNQPGPVREASFDWTPEFVLPPEVAARAEEAMPHLRATPTDMIKRLEDVFRQEHGLPEPMELEARLRAGGWGRRLQREQEMGRQFAEPRAGDDWEQMIRSLYKEMQALEGP